MKKIKKLKKFIGTILTTVVLSTSVLSTEITAFASESETVETVETTNSVPTVSLEDLLEETDKTDDVEETTVNLTIVVPENTIVAKNGVTLTSFESNISLTEGELKLSQPTAMEYKNRITSDIVITIAEGIATAEFEGKNVTGTVTDSLDNSVSFDGETLTIINSDKMEDVIPSEKEEDTPKKPEASPSDYTIRYFVNSVSEENLLHKDVRVGIEGEKIDLTSIDLDAYKPVNTKTEVWSSGIMQDGAATIITKDNTDIIDIVYLSEVTDIPIDGNADFVVKYYKDALQDGNYLGEYSVAGNAGSNIDYSTIDINKFKPASYADGQIQTVVSARTVTVDNSDIIYILYTRVKKETQIVTETIEVPVEVEKIVEVPVEVIKEVEVPVETIVEKEVIKEVPVETVVEKEVIKEVPVVEYVEVPIETVVTKTAIVEVPTERVVEIEKLVEVEKIVEVPGETEIVYVEVPTEKIVEIEKVVEKEVPVYIEVPSETDEDLTIEPESKPSETDADPTIEPESKTDPEMDEDIPVTPEDIPQTGDETPIIMLVIVMMISLFGMVITGKKTKK